ncbi:MAG: DNA-binding response regulator [Halomonadaceae bacterium]|nr:MAG: DNA-binding response regulator [Halomonadaceae bacterium]
MYVLLVEDDPLLASGIETALGMEGWIVSCVSEGHQADAIVQRQAPDIVIMDRGLPDGDGLDWVRLWRNKHITTPVLVLTARDAVKDRIEGLDTGADDYLIKPFDLDELTSRLRALYRRSSGRAAPHQTLGRLAINFKDKQLLHEGNEVNISRLEWRLLEALVNAPGKTFTPDQLQDRLYGYSEGVESNALNVHVHNLRRKLGNDVIETVRGLGFRLGPCQAPRGEDLR